MLKLVGKVTLHNTYKVYEDSGFFYVTSRSKTGSEYRSPKVMKTLLNYVQAEFGGQAMTIKDMERFLEQPDVADRDSIPVKPGHQLYYYAEYLLIVLVSLKRASMEKRKDKYYFRVTPTHT